MGAYGESRKFAKIMIMNTQNQIHNFSAMSTAMCMCMCCCKNTAKGSGTDMSYV